MTKQDIIQNAEAFNNTLTHQINGRLFIDTGKNPHTVAKIVLGEDYWMRCVIYKASEERILWAYSGEGQEPKPAMSVVDWSPICHCIEVF